MSCSIELVLFLRNKKIDLICSLKLFFKKLIMGFCRKFNSEQFLILNFMLKIRSYSSGNRRNFGTISGIFGSLSKEFLSFSKIWLYLTPKNAISCHYIRQKIEKWLDRPAKKFVKEIKIKKNSNKTKIEK